MKPITIRHDVVFQIIFGARKNINLTLDLLEAILESEGKPKELTEPTIQTEVSLEKLKLYEKRGRLDIKIECKERIYSIEMQNKNLQNVYKRANYYISRQMASQLVEGQKYKELKPITMIFILNYKKKEKEIEDFKEHIITVNKKCRELNVDLGFDFIFIYLKDYKSQKEHNMEIKLNQWLSLLNYSNREEMKIAMKLNENVKKANEEFEKLKESREEATLREIEETAWIEEYFAYDAGMTEGKKVGEKIGEKRGEKIGQKKNSIKVAKELLAQNIDIKIIVKATGLTKKELEALAV